MNSRTHIWTGYRHIFFDCDSTLTRIEGIDELAEMVGKGEEVRRLTQQAMEGSIDVEEALHRRLNLLRPTRGQIERIGELYVRNLVADARPVVQALQWLGKNVYILSGGFVLALRRLALHLSIPQQHVLGVDLWFDELQGEWYRYHKHQYRPNPEERYLALDESAPTARSHGKAAVIRQMRLRGARSLLVGDGVSDLLAKNTVDLFVGYGGVVRRAAVEQQAEIYLRDETLAPILVLASSESELERLWSSDFRNTLLRGLQTVLSSSAVFRGRSEAIRDALKRWYEEKVGLLN